MKTRKVSKRVSDMWKDPDTVWGKNLPLEKWWSQLAEGKAVLIYKNGHKMVTVKKNQWDEFDQDDSILDVLTSPRSQDAYEVYLYPKAKNKSVKEVIANYKQYFKPIGPAPKGLPALKKVRVPL
jgi:hypothetical protein